MFIPFWNLSLNIRIFFSKLKLWHWIWRTWCPLKRTYFTSYTCLILINKGCFLLCSWNCNGIHGKILEFKEFINQHSPDIILLHVIHCSPDKFFKIPNYAIIRNYCINPNGSRTIRYTAICIKSNVNFLPAYSLTLNVVNAVEIKIILPSCPRPLLTFSQYTEWLTSQQV